MRSSDYVLAEVGLSRQSAIEDNAPFFGDVIPCPGLHRAKAAELLFEFALTIVT